MSNPAIEEIHIVTINVKNGIFNGPLRPENNCDERPWTERKSRLVDALLSTGPLDILGAQEVYNWQLKDLAELLGPSPIFYDCTKFDVVKWGTTWLSTTPEIPGSIGWDAEITRIATLLTLKYKDPSKKGELVHAVNTHYYHKDTTARAESSLLVRSSIRKWVEDIEQKEKPSKVGPVVFFGDFNSPPDEDGYQNMTSLHPLPSGQPSITFIDTYTHLLSLSSASPPSTSSSPLSPLQTRPYGPAFTYTDFAPPNAPQAKRIDFILLGAEVDNEANRGTVRGGWDVLRYACIDNYVEGDVDGWNARWSDHRAVRATIARLD
ncbi:hypothetical protein I350_05126 [Cryptococcus amylolentus CBS 6273]|uniref:Endonuclease/exonuclease/phosphatase domain-containing protein n=1 Tax=Cryptococcus amylolentus CBS 6273 TaxID=1296118 RepID=A0A1E3JXA6_9TREE|nr:hypothetical protein I350_05126 [Cryptococcus amylolentus CBS 6273]